MRTEGFSFFSFFSDESLWSLLLCFLGGKGGVGNLYGQMGVTTAASLQEESWKRGRRFSPGAEVRFWEPVGGEWRVCWEKLIVIECV